MKAFSPSFVPVPLLWVLLAIFTLFGWQTGCMASQSSIVGVDDLGRKIELL